MSQVGKPLSEIPELSTGAVTRLQEIWVTTAEQLVAMAATPGGLPSLAGHLGVSDERMREIVDAARKQLTEDQVRELETPVDASEYGLGANTPVNTPEPDDE